jgi:hypothetical protein
MGVGGQLYVPVALPTGKGPSTHFTGGWCGGRGRAGVAGRGKSRPHQDSISEPSRPYRVAVLTTLLEKLTVPKIVKKFLAFCGTWKFIKLEICLKRFLHIHCFYTLEEYFQYSAVTSRKWLSLSRNCVLCFKISYYICTNFEVLSMYIV